MRVEARWNSVSRPERTSSAVLTEVIEQLGRAVGKVHCVGYADTVRDDHRHFVEAFREGRIPGVSSS